MPILESETKQSTAPDSVGPAKKPEKTGESWDNLRRLTKSVQKQHRAANARTALFALLLIVTLMFIGWLLHEHLPALVNFGKEVGDTVTKLASNVPKASEPARPNAVQDQRSAHKKPHSNHNKVRHADSGSYDPLLHPFYATALIEGRRVFLTSNDTVIVLDIASGRWSIEAETP